MENSFLNVLQKIRGCFFRFPAALIATSAGSILTIWVMEQGGQFWMTKLIFTLFFSLPLFVSAQLFVENLEKKNNKILAVPAVVLLAVLFFLSLPADGEHLLGRDTLRNALLIAASFTTVFFALFLAKFESELFWQWAKAFAVRFFFSVLFPGIFYVGLIIIMRFISYLFEIRFTSEYFLEVWIVMAGIVAVWFFLAGLPEKKDLREEKFPAPLRHFTHYVLFPLIGLYGAMLLVYLGKILITWSLPKGAVVWPILGFGGLLFTAYFFLRPLLEKQEHRWMNTLFRAFFILLFPFLGLYGAAIGRRIADYGVTENRYFVVMAGIFMAGFALYFLASRRKNLLSVPIALCALLFLTSFGSWGAASISEKSQVRRLQKNLEENGILSAGRIVEEGTRQYAAIKNENEVYSILNYLGRQHGFASIQPWFSHNLSAAKSRFGRVDEVMRLLGLRDL